MTQTMQRWSMDALGRENLNLIQAPVPQPGPGEVRVRGECRCAQLSR
ncbi:alcohol dehydrogenase [Klebsiella oxytoca]|nr:alcohol dehydrogenase [Klebsiella oxytoca]